MTNIGESTSANPISGGEATDGIESVRQPSNQESWSEDSAQSSSHGERSERPQRQVPYGALAEERARRKELQRELNELKAARRGNIGSDEELKFSNETLDNEENDEDYLASSDAAETDESAEGDHHFNELATIYVNATLDYMKTQPDYKNAYQYILQDRAQELIELGYSEQEMRTTVAQNEYEIIQRAMSQGRSPGEVIYNLALRRGYQPSGGASSQRLSEADRIAIAAKGQAGAKSLSIAGGGANGTLSLESLARMNDDEFATATKDDRWEKIMR